MAGCVIVNPLKTRYHEDTVSAVAEDLDFIYELRSRINHPQFDHPPDFNPVLPIASPVQGTVGGALYYIAFGYANLALSGAELKTPSPPYHIGSGIAAQIKECAPGFGPINSSVKVVTPKSIYYACQAYDGAGQPTAATSCKFLLTGAYFGTGGEVQQSFNFTPNLLPIANTFAEGIFSKKFALVTDVTISVVPKLDRAVLVIDLDSFSYTAYL